MDRLQAMRVFVRVAELASFVRAAEALELSRARVSEAVAELERALGVRLVHRSTRRVSLSDDGRAYFERARQILSDVEEAEALVAGSPAQARGKLRVAMPMALARLFVVPALPRLIAQHPELALELRLENRSLDLIEEGIDCALSYGLPQDEDLIARKVSDTHLMTCAARGYLASHGAPRSPAELAQHQCVAFLSLAGARPSEWLFQRRGERTRHSPRAALGFNSMEACVEAAIAGLGVTQVLSSLAERAVAAKQLESVLTSYAADGPSIYVVYPPHRQLSPRLRVLIEFLSEVFAPRADAAVGAASATGRRGRAARNAR